MTRRERIFAAVAVLIAAAALAFWCYESWMTAPNPSAVASPGVHLSPEFLHEFEGFRAADKIADDMRRCLDYPNLPEFHWDPVTVEAVCRFSLNKMITWQEISAALDRHDTKLLEQTFESYLRKNYDGEHGFLTWTFWEMFQNPSKEELQLTQRWVEADPDSAFALTARGIHYMAAAWAARGGKYARDTSAEKFAHMHELADKARADLEEALRRSPKLIAAYHGLLQVALMTSDHGQIESLVEKGLSLDPADPWIYDGWMETAQPKWGGSAAQVAEVVRRAEQHVKENPLLAMERARPYCAVAEMYSCTDCSDKDDAKALEYYRKAAELAPAMCFMTYGGRSAEQTGDYVDAARYFAQDVRFSVRGAIRWRSGALQKLGRADWARDDLVLHLERHPDDFDAMESLGYVYETSDQPGEAEKTYLRILQVRPRHERALLALSRMYFSSLPNRSKAEEIISGLLDRNPKLARAWAYRAVLVCDRSDIECREALEAFLRYADRGDKGQQDEIKRAQAKLDSLPPK